MITDISPKWAIDSSVFSNIVITVDNEEELAHSNFIYTPVPPDAREKVMLISTNMMPWVRYVYIDDPNGRPGLHGALGSDYKLVDGTILKSRTGWSSRAGVINKKYRYMLMDEIVDVTVKFPTWNIGLAGYAYYASFLRNHPLWPKDLHLVRHTMFADHEPYWTISTDRYELKKPTL